jgi:signal transduction histidine kinase
MLFGTLAMVSLTLGIVFFRNLSPEKSNRFNNQLKKLEDEKQQILLNASIKFQEEERNRIAADLHDDVGPLLATARPLFE